MKTMIICMNGLEECEALVVYDLLTRAKIETDLVGESLKIKSSHSLVFECNKTLDEINENDYDCLILPGGMPGTTNLENNNKVSSLIDHFSKNKIICAICAAPSLLIKKGLLKDNEFTCFPGFECGHISTMNKVEVHNNIITANGFGSAIEFGLKIIEVLANKKLSDEIASKIQY